MNKNKLLGYALGPVGSGLLGFISLPIITWFYSVEDVGRIAMLQVFMSFSVLFFCLGLDQAYVREYHEAKNKPALLKTVFVPCLTLSISSFLLLMLYNLQMVSKWLYEVPSTYLSIVSIICFVIALASRFLSLVLRMQERSYAFSMSQLLPKVIFLLIIVNTVWMGLARDTYNLITVNAISVIVAFLVFSWNTRSEWLLAFKEKIDVNQFKQAISFGWPLIFGGLASWGLSVMDRLFLRHFSTYTELGVYSVTMSVAAIVTIFSSIFNTIWSPMVYKWLSVGIYNENKIDEILIYLLMVIYFFIVFSGLFSWLIPFFLPENYSQVQYLIPICLLGPLLYTLSEVTGIGITISRKTKFSMFCSVVAMVVGFLCNYMIVPVLGAKGAAISTALAFFIFLIARTIFSNYLWRKKSYIRMYLHIVLLYIVSLLHLFLEDEWCYMYMLWGVMMLGGLYFYRDLLKRVFFIVYR